MFENAELGHRVDKPTYEREAPRLRAALLEAQRELAEANLSVIVIVAGVGGAGKAETVDLLLDWLDARGIETHAMREPTDEERQRPAMWRFWRALPLQGRIGIFFGAWHARPILDRTFGRITLPQLDQAIDRIVEFERMLHREGVLLVKRPEFRCQSIFSRGGRPRRRGSRTMPRRWEMTSTQSSAP